MNSHYKRPSPADCRKMVNAFGVLPASKIMKLRERTTKIVLFDYVTHLMDKQTSFTDVCMKVENIVNECVEKGLCSASILKPVMKFVNKKFRQIDPALRLHCAVTMEVLEELGGTDNTDPTVLPEEVQEAAECGADCMGSRPSLESLTHGVPDNTQRLYQMVGGALSTEIIQSLSTVLDSEYVRTR